MSSRSAWPSSSFSITNPSPVPPLPPPGKRRCRRLSKPSVARRLQGLLNAAENAVAELLGELPEELNEMPYDSPPSRTMSPRTPPPRSRSRRRGSRRGVARPGRQRQGGGVILAARTDARRRCFRRCRAASGGTAEEAAAAGAAAGAAAAAAAAEAAAKSGADGSRSSSPPSKATGSGGGGGGRTGGADEDVAEEVPEEMNGESSGHNMGASGRGIGLGRRGPASALPMDIPAEANREAAEEWHKKARQQHEAGDDAAALRHLDKSLAVRGQPPRARCMITSASMALDRPRRRRWLVLKAATHHEVMNLRRGPNASSTLPSSRRRTARSLRLHPDRNHAQHASDAFKRLSEAYTAYHPRRRPATQ